MFFAIRLLQHSCANRFGKTLIREENFKPPLTHINRFFPCKTPLKCQPKDTKTSLCFCCEKCCMYEQSPPVPMVGC